MGERVPSGYAILAMSSAESDSDLEIACPMSGSEAWKSSMVAESSGRSAGVRGALMARSIISWSCVCV